MMEKKLRVLHVLVQPVLVWDDGENLTPFEQQIGVVPVGLSEMSNIADKIKLEATSLESTLKEVEGFEMCLLYGVTSK